MPGSSFGRLFSVTTFGESHGPAIGVIVDGVPAGTPLEAEDIQRELNRRRPGQSAITTPRSEKDRVEILSGVFEGITMGTPVSLLIRNEEKKSSDYEPLKDVFRPGHADFTYRAKFGTRDWRGGGRSSGRETATRVAAGAIAKKVLATRGITILGYSLEIGGVRATRVDPAEIERNPARAPDAEAAAQMIKVIEAARAAGDSVGGIAEVVASGCPAGLGDPVFDKLEALLATRHHVSRGRPRRGSGGRVRRVPNARIRVQRRGVCAGRPDADAHQQCRRDRRGHLHRRGYRGPRGHPPARVHFPSSESRGCSGHRHHHSDRRQARPVHRSPRNSRPGGNDRPGARGLRARPRGVSTRYLKALPRDRAAAPQSSRPGPSRR